MILAEMIRMVNFNVDDVIDNQDIVDQLNRAKDQMAARVGCKFPDIQITGDLSESFVFDERFHELPVLYASAMVKAMDSSISEKDSFMVQFMDGLVTFAAIYDPPIQYWENPTCQQFDVEDVSQSEFTITKATYNPVYGKLKVFVNGNQIFDFSKNGNTFWLIDAAQPGDRVTAVWEQDSSLTVKPAYYVGW